MINRKLILIAIFLLALLAISAVSASEIYSADEMAVVDEGPRIEDKVDIDITNDESLLVEDKANIESDEKSLGVTYEGTFADLKEEINAVPYGGVLNLIKNYRYDGGSDDGINIDHITINGNNHTIDGNNTSRIFNIYGNGVVLNDITFSNAKSRTEGGAIYAESVFELNNCKFINSTVFYNSYAGYHSKGGAIYSTKNLKLSNCEFANNDAYSEYHGGFGSAIYCEANVDLFNCTFVNHPYGHDSWGAIEIVYSNSANVKDSFFYDNKAFPLHSNNLNVDNSIFINNSGAIYSYGKSTIRNSIFIDNNHSIADPYNGGSGGAIDARNSKIDNCTFMGNYANEGGALYVSDSDISNCRFINNIAKSGGGAAFISSNSEGLNLSSSNFTNNIAPYGGAVHIEGSKNNLHSLNFLDNEAYLGGALFISYANSIADNHIENCLFANNTASEGEIVGFDVSLGLKNDVNQKSLSVLSNVRIEQNASNLYGGGFSFKDNILTAYGYQEGKYLSGDISILVDGKIFKDSLDSTGLASIKLTGLSAGLHNATILCSDGSDSSSSQTTIPIIIESSYDLKVPDVSKYYGGSEKLKISLSDDGKAIDGATVKVTVNGKTSSLKTDSKGQASLDLNLSPGTYDIVSEYSGISTKSKVTVKSTVTASDSKGTYLNSKLSATFLNVSGKALANNKVSFKVESKTYTATTNSNGLATADVDLGVGSYDVTAINPVNNEQKNFKLTISKAKSVLSLSSLSSNNVLTLTASIFPSVATGNVVFNINNKNYTAKISSGKSVLNITGLNTGNYTVKASYNGDSNFNSSSASTNVPFKKIIITKIVYNNMTTGPVKSSDGRIGNYFVVKLTDDKNNPLAGLPIQIGFNGKIYDKNTTSNGAAKLQINLPREDIYTFAVCFLGDDDYQGSFEVAKITVNKKYPKPNKANESTTGTSVSVNKTTDRVKTSIQYKDMVTTSVLSADGRIGQYFTVKLVDKNNKALAGLPIKIGFNGKIYDKNTTSDGAASLQINLPRVTTYTFAIAYLGDSNYQGSFAVAKITVKAQNPKLTAKSQSFKASAKTKKVSATLLTAKGNPIKKQKISFTVNGKTYTGKTNSKGVATANISLNKKGTYSLAVKFAGMNGCNAKTTKTTVKIV